MLVNGYKSKGVKLGWKCITLSNATTYHNKDGKKFYWYKIGSDLAANICSLSAFAHHEISWCVYQYQTPSTSHLFADKLKHTATADQDIVNEFLVTKSLVTKSLVTKLQVTESLVAKYLVTELLLTKY